MCRCSRRRPPGGHLEPLLGRHPGHRRGRGHALPHPVRQLPHHVRRVSACGARGTAASSAGTARLAAGWLCPCPAFSAHARHRRRRPHRRLPHTRSRLKPRVIASRTGTKDLQQVQLSIRVLSRPIPEKLPIIYRTLGELGGRCRRTAFSTEPSSRLAATRLPRAGTSALARACLAVLCQLWRAAAFLGSFSRQQPQITSTVPYTHTPRTRARGTARLRRQTYIYSSNARLASSRRRSCGPL